MPYVKISSGSKEPIETVLWTNPNMDASNFSMQLSDSISNYKYIKVIHRELKNVGSGSDIYIYVSQIFNPQDIIDNQTVAQYPYAFTSGLLVVPRSSSNTWFTKLLYDTSTNILSISRTIYYCISGESDTLSSNPITQVIGMN